MKTLTKTALLATSLFLALSANAADTKSQSDLLNQCQTSVSGQIENLERVKVANIKSRRDLFQAKFRVTAAGERSTVVCTIGADATVALTCAKGAVCAANSIASN